MAKVSKQEKALNERFMKAFDYLTDNKQVGSDKALCNMLGLHQSNMAKYKELDREDARAVPMPAVINLITMFKDLNGHWLLSGEGKMLLSEDRKLIRPKAPVPPEVADTFKQPLLKNTPTPVQEFAEDKAYYHSMPKVVTVDSNGEENILYVPVAARAGYMIGYGDTKYIDNPQTFKLPHLKGSSYRMFQVAGDSMDPTLVHGDIVVAEWVEHPREIRSERVYILVLKKYDKPEEGIIIKRLVNGLDKFGKIIAKSDNPNRTLFRNQDFSLSDIQEVWYARSYFSYNFPAPADTYVRLTNVEVELEIMKKAVQKLLNQ